MGTSLRFKRLVFLTLGACVIGIGASAQAPQVPAGRDISKSEALEKISLVFSGLLPSPDELNSIESGALSLDSYLENLRTKPDVETKIVQYWLSVLKISDKFDPTSVRASDNSPTAETLNTQGDRNTFTFQNSKIIDITKISDKLVYNSIRKIAACSTERVTRTFGRQVIRDDATLEVERGECRQNPNATLAQRCLASLDTYVTVTRPKQLADLDAVECECGSETSVRPWWNPAVSIKACPDAVNKCGPTLSGCQIYDVRLDPRLGPQHANNYHSSSNYGTDVIDNLTIEPALIIARNILSNQDFRGVLTANATYLNGATEHYLSGPGSLLVRNAPPGSYKTSAGASTLVASQPQRRTYRPVARGAQHAGILTTPMFQQVTNG